MANSSTDEKKRIVLADLSLLLVALAWGGGFIVLKDTLDNMTPYYIMAIRFTLSFILMSLIFHKKFTTITKKDVIAGIFIGSLLFTAFATQTVGLKYTTAGKQAFLTGTNVVIVPFLYWMLTKNLPDKFSTVGAFLTFIGIGLLTLQDGFNINIGDLLTLICAVFYAAHIVSVGHYTQKSDPIILTLLQIGVAAILFIIFALVFEPIPQELGSEVIMGIGYLVVFSTTLAFLIQNIAQKMTTSTHAAIILSLESVFGALLAVLILKDRFTLTMTIGCIFIFVAVIITETKLEFFKFGKKNMIKEDTKVE